MNFVVCIEKSPFGDFTTEDLTVGRLYEVVDDTDSHDMIRIIDDSGDDYLYPARLFDSVQLPTKTAERLHEALLAA